MRVTRRFLFIAASLAIVSAGVIADTVPTIAIPESFLLGHAAPADTAKPAAAPTDIEKPLAVNGALYAVVAPVYMGTGGTNSYIRAFNGGAVAANFSFTVVGSPSGTTYGTANVSIPSRASQQLNTFGTASAPGIFDLAGVTGLRGADTGVAVYIQSTEPTAGYQHVTFNTTNFFFENASVCAYPLNDTIKSVVNSQVITNIHTTLFPTYPAQVTIHNSASAATTYTVTVISASTGAIKGTVNVAIPANSTVTQPMSYFETQAGWTPSAALGELHANLVVTAPNSVAPQVILGQSVINQTVSNALVNMGQACAVNAPVSASSALDAVVAPVYMGAGGTNSYIRAFNGGATAANFSFTVVGSPSGTTYGTANVSIPSRASQQLNTFGTASAPGIFDLAGVTGLRGADTTVAVRIQSAEPTAGYQHVTFNTTNFFFENASVCAYSLNNTIKSVVNSQVLTNLHTTLFPTYPTQVTIHNHGSAPVTYTVTVISAATGAIKGTVNVAIAANATVTQPMSFFEAQSSWTPSAALGELHANLVVTNPSGAAPEVTLGQSVINQTVQNALVNMGQACAVNAPVAASGGGGGSGGGGSGDGGGFGDGGGISY